MTFNQRIWGLKSLDLSVWGLAEVQATIGAQVEKTSVIERSAWAAWAAWALAAAMAAGVLGFGVRMTWRDPGLGMGLGMFLRFGDVMSSLGMIILSDEPRKFFGTKRN